MAKKSRNKDRDTQYEYPVKTDNEFRIHMKTNDQGRQIAMCLEYPNGEQSVRNYGNIPRYETLEEYRDKEFEFIVDGEYLGKRRLLSADSNFLRYEEI